jgi:hypothetical protein
LLASSVNTRVDHLNVVWQHSLNSAASRKQAARPEAVDPKLNIAIYGASEDRDDMVWQRIVNDALRHVTNNSVDVTDMFRIDRYGSSKKRPVLIKLKTFEDKILIDTN